MRCMRCVEIVEVKGDVLCFDCARLEELEERGLYQQYDESILNMEDSDE